MLTHLTQNGGYINPPRIKRQFRDPYGDWWDKQERRNFGEPVHEDNDILGIFSPYEYTWASTGKAVLLFSSFVATLLGGISIVYFTYPDMKSYPREFEDGLERELGGAGAVRVSLYQPMSLDPTVPLHRTDVWMSLGPEGRRSGPVIGPSEVAP